MDTTRWYGLGLALLLSACGGGGAPRGNAAEGAVFSYAAPEPATADQAGAMGGAIAGMDSFQAAPGGSAGLAAADAAAVPDGLLTGSPFTAYSASALGATATPAFDVPACVTVVAGKVTFGGCRVSLDATNGGVAMVGAVTLDGEVARDAGGRVLTWSLASGVTLTLTGTGTATVASATRSAGRVEVTDTAAAGAITSELTVTVTADGQAVGAALDQSLAFDLVRSASCPTGVVGGTLEAKRVWTVRPQGATPAALPDEAVKITWQGCGVATVQLGSR